MIHLKSGNAHSANNALGVKLLSMPISSRSNPSLRHSHKPWQFWPMTSEAVMAAAHGHRAWLVGVSSRYGGTYVKSVLTHDGNAGSVSEKTKETIKHERRNLRRLRISNCATFTSRPMLVFDWDNCLIARITHRKEVLGHIVLVVLTWKYPVDRGATTQLWLNKENDLITCRNIFDRPHEELLYVFDSVIAIIRSMMIVIRLQYGTDDQAPFHDCTSLIVVCTCTERGPETILANEDSQMRCPSRCGCLWILLFLIHFCEQGACEWFETSQDLLNKEHTELIAWQNPTSRCRSYLLSNDQVHWWRMHITRRIESFLACFYACSTQGCDLSAHLDWLWYQ